MKKDKQKKILITGGFGYIGSLLAKTLVKEGQRVYIFDSLIYEQNRFKILNEINQGHGKNKAELIIGDTRNLDLLESSVKNIGPDYIFHLAELSSVYSCDHNVPFTKDINFNGSKNVVDISCKYSIPLIYNSTSSLYGSRAGNREMNENDPIPKPTDNYCLSKLTMERYISNLKKKHNRWRVIVLRPATVGGLSPRMRLELMPNHFTYCALAKKEIKISEPDAYRAAIDIRDLVRIYQSILTMNKWNHLIYNVGSLNLNKRQFAEGVQNVVPCAISAIPSIGDCRNLKIDCSRFDNEFNFKSKFSYEDGVRTVANWLTAHITEIERTNFIGVINMSSEKWKKII